MIPWRSTSTTRPPVRRWYSVASDCSPVVVPASSDSSAKEPSTVASRSTAAISRSRSARAKVMPRGISSASSTKAVIDR